MTAKNDQSWNIFIKVSACLVPVMIPVFFSFGAWVVSEVYAGKYERLTQDDEIRIKAECKEEMQEHFDLLREDILRLEENQQEILRRLPPVR
jgi:hypothetical protein